MQMIVRRPNSIVNLIRSQSTSRPDANRPNFLRDRHVRLLGCLLFDPAGHGMTSRDAWTSWQDEGAVARRLPDRPSRASGSSLRL